MVGSARQNGMGIRIGIGALVVIALGGLGFWLLGGEDAPRSEVRGPRPSVPVPKERGGEPLHPVEGVGSEDRQRESVRTDEPDAGGELAQPSGISEPDGWPGTCSLFGRLVDEDGRSVSARRVWITDERGETHPVEVESGRYRAVGLTPGRWWIQAQSEVYLPVREEVGVYRTDGALELDLVFAPKLLVAVNVLASTGGSFWEGLSDAELLYGVDLAVVATREQVHDPAGIARSNAGSFRRVERKGRDLTDPMLGTLEVEVAPPLYASLMLGTRVVAVQVLEAGMQELTFVVDPTAVIQLLVTLRFRVLDSAGLPSDEASVILQLGESMSTTKLPPSAELEYDGLVPGTAELMVMLQGHAMIKRSIELVPPLVDLGDLRLELATGLRGTVVDSEGSALRGDPGSMRSDVMIEFARRDEATGEFAIDGSLNLGVDAEGSFGLDLETGTYLIRARGEWTSRNLVVQVPGDPVRLEVFPPSVVVLSLETGDWENWSFAIVDEGQHPAATGRLQGNAPRRIKLPSGFYELRLTDAEGQARQEVPFELRQEELIINLTL